MWALAMSAILTQYNGGRHDLLGGRERTPEEIEAWRATLAASWDIESRADMIMTLGWIERRGHRGDFDELADYLSDARPDEITDLRRRAQVDPDSGNQIDIVLKQHELLGNRSIAAWDYGRYASLCGSGYLIGYLTEDEVWRRLMPVARQMQTMFGSWEEFGNNYLVGREFWSLAETNNNGNQMRQTYRALLSNPQSPWVKIPWNLDLEPPKIN